MLSSLICLIGKKASAGAFFISACGVLRAFAQAVQGRCGKDSLLLYCGAAESSVTRICQSTLSVSGFRRIRGRGGQLRCYWHFARGARRRRYRSECARRWLAVCVPVAGWPAGRGLRLRCCSRCAGYVARVRGGYHPAPAGGLRGRYGRG